MSWILVWWAGAAVVLQEIHLSSKMHNEWAVPTITLSQPLPSICGHKEREKPCTLLMYMSLLPRVSRKTKQLNWLTDARHAHALSQEHRPGEGWLHLVAFSLGQLSHVLLIIALPYAYLGLIIMFFPRNTLHCFSPVWQHQRSTEEAAWMNAFAHHINSWKKRLCKYFISTAVGFDLRATSVAVLSKLKAFKYAQIWHVRLIAM